MIIECPSCETRYDMAADLPPVGRKVRCARCGNVWRAMPPKPEAEETLDLPAEAEAHKPAAMAANPAQAPRTIADDVDFENAAVEMAPDIRPEDEDANAAKDAFRELDRLAPMAAEPPFSARPNETGGWAENEDVAFDASEARAVRPTYDPITIQEPLRQQRSRQTTRLMVGWTLLGVFALGVLGSAIIMRAEVVRALPGAAPMYAAIGLPVNLRGLEINDLSYAWTTENGRRFIEVRGQVVNVTSTPITVPTLTFALRDDAETEIQQWSTRVRDEPLPAGQSASFVTRLPAATRATPHSVTIRFASKS